MSSTEYIISYANFMPYSSLALSMIKLGMAMITNQKGFVLISPKLLVRNAFYDFLIQISIFSVLFYLMDNRILEKIFNKLKNSNKKNILSISQGVNNSYISLEREKLNNTELNSNLTVKIKDLVKIYTNCFGCGGNNTLAVNNLSLGLEPNEKFGLMGFNGSGKTTTFKSITDEICYDRGDIKLFNFDTKKDFGKIRRDMGYCPQSHALFDYLSVQETFEFYMNLKLKKGKDQIGYLLKKFGLDKFRHTICTNLSGGNKRKLNFAIALMNNPRVILLDEPSTGVDPESRRMMWKNINDIPKFTPQYNMILSTHSMEEAEILCDTIGWMRNGNFVCIGNPEKLKLQFSQGYYLHIKYRKPSLEILEKYQNWDREKVRRNFTEFSRNVENFYIEEVVKNLVSYPESSNENIFYLEKLENTVKKIKSNCEKISIGKIDLDNPGEFEVVINVDPNLQGVLFSMLLNLKLIDTDIQEINLNMQSLENILTSL
jgi:ABC-type multidrug transport system ATPase subunit